MILVQAWTYSLVLWVVLWAIGVKALDGFMLVLVIMIGAVVHHILWPMLPGNRQRQQDT